MPNVGDTKKITWKISAAEVGFSLATVDGVRGFIAAAGMYAKGKAKETIAALLGGTVVDVAVLTATAFGLAFSSLATATGHEGAKVTINMVYSSWSKHQGGAEVTVYGWKAQGIAKCEWY